MSTHIQTYMYMYTYLYGCDDYLMFQVHLYTLMDAQSCFRSMYADFQKQLNPAEISGDLFVAELITETEQEEINNTMLPQRQRTTMMLAALQKAIKINPGNLSKFLDILDTVPLYKDIAKKARGKLT